MGSNCHRICVHFILGQRFSLKRILETPGKCSVLCQLTCAKCVNNFRVKEKEDSRDPITKAGPEGPREE